MCNETYIKYKSLFCDELNLCQREKYKNMIKKIHDFEKYLVSFAQRFWK